MNSIEEKLWSYIDGTCTAAQREQISRLILTDEDYKQQYEELLQLHNEFSALELDEPPMAFTYNVMEQIRTQEARVPLKANINNRIIIGIAAFFAVSITILLGFVFHNINWTGNHTGFKIPVQFSAPKFDGLFTGPWMKGFLFFDLVMGLFLFDAWLRKDKVVKQEQLH